MVHKEPWRRAFGILLNRYRRDCQRRNIYWALAEEQFLKLTQGICTYCGTKPKQRVWVDNPLRTYVYNGVDRKDSRQGYTPDNCTPCCGECNSIKGKHLNFEEAKAAITAVLGVRKNK